MFSVELVSKIAGREVELDVFAEVRVFAHSQSLFRLRCVRLAINTLAISRPVYSK